MNRPPRAARQIPAVLIIFAAAAAACGLWLGNRFFGATTHAPMQNAALYPTPRDVPDFHLAQANGNALARDDWRGHWNLVYFGYASCPDVCPTTLAVFKQVWQELAKRRLADKIRFDFISIDPERDTPERLAAYVRFFHPDFIAATGSDEELLRLTRAMGVVYSRTTNASGAIEVDHSGSVIIVDPDARVVGMFRPPFTPAPLVADLGALVADKD